MTLKMVFAAALAFIIAFSLLPACEKPSSVDGYLILAPEVFPAGGVQTISIALFSGKQPASGKVRISLVKDGHSLTKTTVKVYGKGVASLPVPSVPPGEYRLEIEGPGFHDQASVKIERMALVFLETDKPIYKPGQRVRMRVLTLDPELKPFPTKVIVEVRDAKGIKVFRKAVRTDDYGMVTLELPLSTEPNLGVWKVIATSGNRSTQTDIRVEKYVLPKYEVKVDLTKEWFLVDEPIRGKVRAEYSFGKPVKGEVEIIGKRYVGTWEQYASLTKEIDGEAEFELPAVKYVVGVPGARGMGKVLLEVAVREKATGYEEKNSSLLTISPAPVSLQVIPESPVFKPALPFSLLLVTETPDNHPLDREVEVSLTYLGKGFKKLGQEKYKLNTFQGKAILQITPPVGSIALTIEASSGKAKTFLALNASYSPSGNFIHVVQESPGIFKVGGRAKFKVYSTTKAGNFYYEVLSRGRLVFTGISHSHEISFTVTPIMAPVSRLLVYQIAPNAEVAADYIPFKVETGYPHDIEVRFSPPEVAPGGEVNILVRTEGPAKVGLTAVDRSVFMLAEKRLNLQQIFAELERLFLHPQAELHNIEQLYVGAKTKGAADIFRDVGMIVLSNKKVPKGKEYRRPRPRLLFERALGLKAFPPPTPIPVPAGLPRDLAEVQRVRQFFPETWLWTELFTNESGQASLTVRAPDSITTWVLRAIALSREKGLGLAESNIRAFQPFFLQPDLPYSAIRGEEFPVRVALYNYLDSAQKIFVELEKADWFELLDSPVKMTTVAAHDVGSVEFRIRPKALGTRKLGITARSKEAADAVIREILIEPEGVARERVDSFVISAGDTLPVNTSVPPQAVPGSARVYLTLTGNYLTQTVKGLEKLLRMPFGCGEQNMILMAPNTFILRYLKATDQLKPEVMAKAELLMLTGYQRELIFRRNDGSFSAFGEQDKEGSLWLTAFVLKTFAQAREFIFIDKGVLDGAQKWIVEHQQPDGSFESIGFVHHEEMLGGVQGKTALTAFVAIALLESGERNASVKAVHYLERQLDDIEDPYTMAITAYALELADSPEKDRAYKKLMEMAEENGEGLHWGEEHPVIKQPKVHPFKARKSSVAVEATGYATLALLRHGDLSNASRAARWLIGQRNAYGGFSSTQDTVVGLQALTEYSRTARADVNLRITLKGKGWRKEIAITPENSDLLQVVEMPAGEEIEVRAEGKGKAVIQAVRRFNLPRPEVSAQQAFQLDVRYSAEEVQENDLVIITVRIKFTPPEPVRAGMVVLDVAVPTGFRPEESSVKKAIRTLPKIKRFDMAGRKVIFYIEDMLPGEELSLSFKARALYPVRAKPATSRAYSYYRPEWQGESLGPELTILSR